MKWKYIFEVIDINKDNKINHSELHSGLKKLGVSVEESTVLTLMNRFQDHSKVIGLDDFLQICCKCISAQKSYEKVVKGGNALLDTFMLHIIDN